MIYKGFSHGGLIGEVEANDEKKCSLSIKNCSNFGTVDSYGGVSAGIVGGFYGDDMNINIANCKNDGMIRATARYHEDIPTIGGIVGTVSYWDENFLGVVKITDCNNNGNINFVGVENNNSKAVIGGICGYVKNIQNAKIVGCTNSGSITTEKSCINIRRDNWRG